MSGEEPWLDPHETQKPRAREDVLFRRLDDEWVLYDPVAEELHVLNRAAAAVWLALDGQSTAGDISQLIRETLGSTTPPGQLGVDVREAISSFAKRGLLE